MTTDARDPRDLDEDGFHEIQLSGKQLVFLCMATTVVSIVIFLCGVLVGRGVRPVEPVAEAAAVSPTEVLPPESPSPAADPGPAAGMAAGRPNNTPPPPAPDVPPADAPSASEPAPSVAAQPAPAAATPTAPPPAAAPKPEPKKPAPASTAAAKSTPPPAPVADAPKPAAAPAPAAAGGGEGSGKIAVQVGALRERGEAEALARRLSGKGYAAYIVAPDAGAASPMFRVRVGNYTSADEAARVKRRLEQEEKLKPWIIR